MTLTKAPIYLLSNLINALIPFLLLPILTRVLTPAEYGIIAMFTVSIGIFNAFTGLSLHGAVNVRYFDLSKEEMKNYISTCVLLLIISTLLVLLVVISSNSWLPTVLGIPNDWLIVAVIISGFQFIANIRLALWQVTGKAWSYGGFQISRTLLDALLSLVLILGVSMAWQGRLLAQSIAFLTFGGIALYWLYKEDFFKLPERFRLYSRDALSFGIPLIPHTIGGLLVITTDRIIIANILGNDSVGIYMVAFQVSQVLGLIADSFNKAYAPWLYKQLSKTDKSNHPFIIKGTYAYFLIIMILAIIFGFTAPYLVQFMAGNEFWLSGTLVIYIAIGFAFGGCYYMVVNYLFFAKKTKNLAITTFMTGIINIPLTYFLVMKYGLEGAAIAFLIIKLLNFIIIWPLSNKLYPMPWLGVFKKRN